MTIKQGVFSDYVKKRESRTLREAIKKRAKYTHHNVFDTPLSTTKKEDSYYNSTIKTTDKMEHKRNTEPNTNGTQNLTQTEHKEPEHRGNGTQMEHKRNTNGTQNPTQNIAPLKGKVSLSLLSGLQKQMCLSLYKNCRIHGSKVTQEVSVEYLTHLTSCNKSSVKTTISRLKQKGYIELYEYKGGRAGWTKYKLNDVLYADILQHENLLLPGHLTALTEHKHNTEPDTEPVYSSSIKYNTTTKELPEQWINLTISPLEHIGFSVTQLKQLSKLGCCNTEVIQDAIYQFAYDLEYNNLSGKLKTSPLNALMGVLRKGQGWNAHNYKPPQDIALGKILERKKQEQASREKQLKELYSLEFEEWLSSKTDDELKDIYLKQAGSGANFFKYGGVSNAPTRAGLSKYFEENVWVNKIQDLNSYKN